MSGRIIIDYDESITPWDAVALVSTVIAQGKVSSGPRGVPHYCWATIIGRFAVYTRIKSHGTETDSFKVMPSGKPE